jgi:hypothetical protein
MELALFWIFGVLVIVAAVGARIFIADWFLDWLKRERIEEECRKAAMKQEHQYSEERSEGDGPRDG